MKSIFCHAALLAVVLPIFNTKGSICNTCLCCNQCASISLHPAPINGLTQQKQLNTPVCALEVMEIDLAIPASTISNVQNLFATPAACKSKVQILFARLAAFNLKLGFARRNTCEVFFKVPFFTSSTCELYSES